MIHEPPHPEPNRRGVLIAATSLPVCLMILLAIPQIGPQAPCADTRPEDIGRALPEQLAPLVPPGAPYCAMTAGLARIDLPADDTPLSAHLTSLDSRMRDAGWARCDDTTASVTETTSRCFERRTHRLELTAHISQAPSPALVLHATVAPR